MRRSRGMTQAQLAEHLGADRTTVVAMEAGRPPGQERFFRAIGWMGYDLVAVPRGSRVTVVESEVSTDRGHGDREGQQ
ncbi:helix-turn-helix transcriptional regulator [Actinocrinis puniceicyclus]|uniref:Helix-turn-helix transcriptional regulator n=1 Tax=Actinocrinis puniceicyclus TaxID=977794 RepID=A0A8J7WSV3_9ACTN|nr:helix-turn-helix transcriptional regulator [Actinocrinis puniceicyclus]MBS2965387.1 helix-turn-helix transcriptional regulator [Actinocrinis puniceicyclus]